MQQRCIFAVIEHRVTDGGRNWCEKHIRDYRRRFEIAGIDLQIPISRRELLHLEESANACRVSLMLNVLPQEFIGMFWSLLGVTPCQVRTPSWSWSRATLQSVQ